MINRGTLVNWRDRSLVEKLSLLSGLVSGDIDQDEDDYVNYIDIFRDCYKEHCYADSGDRPLSTASCGSSRLEDPVKSLYRLIWLLEPSMADFSDLLLGKTLIEVCSEDYNFCCSFSMHRYEFSAYFHCSKKYHQDNNRGEICIKLGIPGHDNGERCTSKTGNLWFSTLINVLNHEHMIYGGNNFVV